MDDSKQMNHIPIKEPFRETQSIKILKYCIHFSVNFAIVFRPGFSQNNTRRILLQRICLVNTDISFLRVVFDKLLPELKAFH